MEQFLYVRGVSYRQPQVEQVEVGDPVLFEPDPDNEHDRNAIRVLVMRRGKILHVGFVPAELCASLRPYIDGTEKGQGRAGYWNADVAEKEYRDGNWVLQVKFELDGFLPRQSSVSSRGGA